jgi:hypothetical protein
MFRTLSSVDGPLADGLTADSMHRNDPARTLVVSTSRPHPWAVLRDRLDPDMVRVAWLPAAPPPPGSHFWGLVGEGLLPIGLKAWPAIVWWVGSAPPELPQARHCTSWNEVAHAVSQALQIQMGAVRLAPICGLIVNGRQVSRCPQLESLLAAMPQGLPLPDEDDQAVRRLQALVRKRNLPLEVIMEGAVIRVRALSSSHAGAT